MDFSPELINEKNIAESSILVELQHSLKNESSNAHREKWALIILERQIPMLELIDLVHAERNVALRFMWLSGHICDKDPTVIYPALTTFFNKRKDVQILNYNCSITKMLFKAGVPPEIEAEVIDELFQWMADSNLNVSTKVYAMGTLNKLAIKYPDLKNELASAIHVQMFKSKSSFDKLAIKILKKLT